MPLDKYRAWKRQSGQVGCVFARYMAARPTEFGQRAEVVLGADPAVCADEVAARVTTFVDDPAVIAAALVFPDLNDLGSVALLALSLAARPNWTVTRTILSGTPLGDVVAFNVVRTIPMAGGACPSEALVLGPYDDFPSTRRAPVTALELFVGSPPAQKRNGQPTTKVHLADVPIELPHAAVFDRMWESTIALRLSSLGGVDDTRAKAKVAFAIPVALATQLGCLP